jgi:hypothetical protein
MNDDQRTVRAPNYRAVERELGEGEETANDAWAAAHMERDRGDRWQKIADQRAIEVADLRHALSKYERSGGDKGST